jgi:hypothetical protein
LYSGVKLLQPQLPFVPQKDKFLEQLYEPVRDFLCFFVHWLCTDQQKLHSPIRNDAPQKDKFLEQDRFTLCPVILIVIHWSSLYT